MPEIDAVRIPLPEMQAAKLILALAPVYLPGVGREAARLMLGHTWGVELARGKGAYGHNIGNIMAAGFNPKTGKEKFVWEGDYWRPPWFKDRTDPRHALMLKGKAPSAFRAYSDYKAGMSAYLKHLASKMPEETLSGRAAQFAQGIWNTRYCRDDNCQPSVLTRTLKQLSHEFGTKGYFESLPSIVAPGKNTGMLLAATGVLAVTGFIFYGTIKDRKASRS